MEASVDGRCLVAFRALRHLLGRGEEISEKGSCWNEFSDEPVRNRVSLAAIPAAEATLIITLTERSARFPVTARSNRRFGICWPSIFTERLTSLSMTRTVALSFLGEKGTCEMACFDFVRPWRGLGCRGAIVWLLVFCHAQGLGAAFAAAPTAQAAARLDAMIAEAQSQREQLRPIWVKYKMADYGAPDSGAATSGGAVGKAAKQAKPSEFKYEMDVELAIKGNLSRASFSGPLFLGGQVIRKDLQRVSVYDGEKTVLSDGDSTQGPNSVPIFKLSKDPQRASGYEVPESITGQAMLLDLLRDWQLNREAYKVAINDEKDEDGAVVFVELRRSRDNALVARAWLLPAPGLVVKRLETYYMNGKLDTQNSDVKYEDVDGLRYPKSAIFREYSEDGDFVRERRLHVNSVTLRASEIPDSLFRLEIPPGAAAYDLDRNTLIRDPARIQGYIDEMIVPRPYRKQWFRICLCLAGILILGGIFVYRQLVRRYGRGRNAIAQ